MNLVLLAMKNRLRERFKVTAPNKEKPPICPFCGKPTKRDKEQWYNGEWSYTCWNKGCERAVHCTKDYLENKIKIATISNEEKKKGET